MNDYKEGSDVYVPWHRGQPNKRGGAGEALYRLETICHESTRFSNRIQTTVRELLPEAPSLCFKRLSETSVTPKLLVEWRANAWPKKGYEILACRLQSSLSKPHKSALIAHSLPCPSLD
jgi:hypothetical protein